MNLKREGNEELQDRQEARSSKGSKTKYQVGLLLVFSRTCGWAKYISLTKVLALKAQHSYANSCSIKLILSNRNRMKLRSQKVRHLGLILLCDYYVLNALRKWDACQQLHAYQKPVLDKENPPGLSHTHNTDWCNGKQFLRFVEEIRAHKGSVDHYMPPRYPDHNLKAS